MYLVINKECENCGYELNIELDDELLDELDMNGYAIIACEDCGGDIDVYSEDFDKFKSSKREEYGIYEIESEEYGEYEEYENEETKDEEDEDY